MTIVKDKIFVLSALENWGLPKAAMASARKVGLKSAVWSYFSRRKMYLSANQPLNELES